MYRYTPYFQPIEIPSNLRTRDHMSQILGLAPSADDKEKLLAKTEDNTLRELKKLYDVAIKPLEILYKYRDLSNRHFGGMKATNFTHLIE